MTPVADELSPYLPRPRSRWPSGVCTLAAAEGQDALALFLTSANAESYAQSALKGSGWQVVRPPRTSVLEVLRACHDSGVLFAVLDPDAEKAKRVFSIGEVLQAVAGIG